MDLILGQGQTQLSPDAALVFSAMAYLLAFLLSVIVIRWVFRVNAIVASQKRIIEELKRIGGRIEPKPAADNRTALEAAAERDTAAAGRQAPR